MHKIWKYEAPTDELLVIELQKQINVSAFIAESLVKRGVKNFEEAKTFFRPNLDLLHSPFLMLNMQDAVDCVLRNQKNKILIYGDYDVDGTTAVSLLFNFLKQNNFNVEYYIPSRYKEGYGVSMLGVQKAIDENFSLMIALDCGITALEQAETLKNKVVDFIICDHHFTQCYCFKSKTK
jgi:single-stranded-DNA-specific exonuclease